MNRKNFLRNIVFAIIAPMLPNIKTERHPRFTLKDRKDGETLMSKSDATWYQTYHVKVPPGKYQRESVIGLDPYNLRYKKVGKVNGAAISWKFRDL